MRQRRFLWCFFQIEDICSQTCGDDIRKTILSLPKDLPESYERALYRIIHAEKVDIAAQVFRLVAAAKRPLSIEELREAIAVEPLTSRINEGRLVNERQLVPWCASLIVQDEDEHLIQFAHHSVKEFLLSDSDRAPPSCFEIRLREASHELAETCLTYLGFDAFKTQVVKVSRTQVPLAPLTPKSILETSLSTSKSSTLYRSWQKLERFLGKQSDYNADVWGQLDSLREGFDNRPVPNLRAHHSFLAYASEYWLTHTVKLRPGDSYWGSWRSLVLSNGTVAARPWTMEEWWTKAETVKQYIYRKEPLGVGNFIPRFERLGDGERVGWSDTSRRSR